MAWIRRFRAFWRPQHLERDLDDELQFHVEMRARENETAGMPPDEARRDALRRFGNMTVEQELTRDRDIHRWLDAATQDLRYAARVLRRSPVFTSVAVISIAIGIGANTAIFSLLNAVLLKMLPVRNPEQLVSLRYKARNAAGLGFTGFAYPWYQDLRDRSADQVDLFAEGGAALDFLSNGEVERIRGTLSAAKSCSTDLLTG
jgi:hypothetical protein